MVKLALDLFHKAQLHLRGIKKNLDVLLNRLLILIPGNTIKNSHYFKLNYKYKTQIHCHLLFLKKATNVNKKILCFIALF